MRSLEHSRALCLLRRRPGRAGRTLPVPVPLFAESDPKVKNQGGRVGWVESEDAPQPSFQL